MTHKVKSQFHLIPNTSLTLYHAQPIHGKVKGVLVVFHEAYGLTGHMKTFCNRLAHEGYSVYAPELLHRKGEHLVVGKEELTLTLGEYTTDNIRFDIKETLSFIREREQVTDEDLSCIGFFVGGYVSLLAGSLYPLRGSVSFYGAGVSSHRTDLPYEPLGEELAKIKGEVLLFYGEEDYSVKTEEREKVKETLGEAGVRYGCREYQECNHGFFCNSRRSYNKEAASEAWDLLLGWLNRLYSKA